MASGRCHIDADGQRFLMIKAGESEESSSPQIVVQHFDRSASCRRNEAGAGPIVRR